MEFLLDCIILAGQFWVGTAIILGMSTAVVLFFAFFIALVVD
jgi:hypothetical protein